MPFLESNPTSCVLRKTGRSGFHRIVTDTDKGLALLDGNAAPLKAFTTSVEEVAKPHAPLIERLSTNPGSDSVELMINLLATASVRVSVHNALGQDALLAFEGVLDEGAQSIVFNTSSLTAGAYMVRVVGGGVTECSQLMINR